MKNEIKEIIEEVCTEICDKYCKYPLICEDNDEMIDTVCANCPLGRIN